MGENGRQDDDLITLTEAAVILAMKQSNVSAFLKRRDVQPVVKRRHHRRWSRSQVEAARDEYERSERYASDQRRRRAARRARS